MDRSVVVPHVAHGYAGPGFVSMSPDRRRRRGRRVGESNLPLGEKTVFVSSGGDSVGVGVWGSLGGRAGRAALWPLPPPVSKFLFFGWWFLPRPRSSSPEARKDWLGPFVVPAEAKTSSDTEPRLGQKAPQMIAKPLFVVDLSPVSINCV